MSTAQTIEVARHGSLASACLAASASKAQALIRFAVLHGNHAESRDEGDVAVFCECTVPDGMGGYRGATEIEVVSDMRALRAVLGY